jgi:hypothetical protein
MESFLRICVKIIGNSGYEPDHGFFVTISQFNETKIILVYTLFDSYPLMLLKLLLLNYLTAFHNLRHFIYRDHWNTSKIYSTKSLQNFLDMLRLVSLAVNYSWGELALKNL